MNRDYITVKEFAELAGIKHQSVYKRLQDPENELYSYMKVIGKKKCIARAALSEIYRISEDEPEVQPGCNTVAQVAQPDSTETVAFLKAEIERLHSVIEAEKKEKEQLRTDMQRTIDSLLELTKQSNFIAAAQAQKQLTEAEPEKQQPQSGSNAVEATATDTAPVDPAEPQQLEEQQERPKPQPIKPNNPLPKQKQTKQKRGFWKRFF